MSARHIFIQLVVKISNTCLDDSAITSAAACDISCAICSLAFSAAFLRCSSVVCFSSFSLALRLSLFSAYIIITKISQSKYARNHLSRLAQKKCLLHMYTALSHCKTRNKIAPALIMPEHLCQCPKSPKCSRVDLFSQEGGTKCQFKESNLSTYSWL